jgi:hypothetical protein
MSEKRKVVELTAKRWKGLQAAGIGALLLGVVMCVGSVSGEGSAGTVTAATLLMVAGAATVLVARLLAWWHHG